MKTVRNLRKINRGYLFLILVCAFLGFGMQPILFSQVSYTVDFNISDLNIHTVTAEDGNMYDKVAIAELAFTNELGKPCLPVKYVKLIIPSDQDVDDIIIRYTNKRKLTVAHLIYPVQPPVPTSVNLSYKKHAFIRPDLSVYESNKPYPTDIVEVVHEGYFDGTNHIVTLAIYPLQYYPKSGRLDFFRSIDFILQMKTCKMKRKGFGTRSKKNQKMYDHILKKLVDNQQDVTMYQTHPSLGKAGTIQTTTLPSYEYVVITSEALKPYFEVFVSWKIRKGINAGIVTVEQILANYSTDNISGITDNAGALRQYLADSYYDGNPRTVYALLGGDYTVVPVRYGAGDNNRWTVYTDDDYKIPTDLYFADFTGDWDVDGADADGVVRYGERNDDDPDYYPEIFVGRLLCSSSQDVKNWVEKLLKYEQNPGNGEIAYLTKSFMIISDQMQDWYNPNQAVQVSQHLTMFNHTIWEEDPSGYAQNPTFPTAHKVIVEMNNHYGLYSWFGHGSPISITTMSSFFNENPRYCINTVDNIETGEVNEVGDALECLSNVDYPSILYSIGCNNTPFDDYNPHGWFPGRNLGEGFTVLTKAGGPAFLGNTRYGWVGSSYQLYKKFADLITGGTYNLGRAELISKSQYNYHYLSYSHNLVGCPETEIWTAIPTQFTNVSIADNGSSITVNTDVSGCNICVSSGDNGATFWQVAANVSGYTFNTSVRPLYITITKHNYIPYTAVSGGTFSSNEYWFGNLYVFGSVVIDGNSTLSILPGTTVKFGGYYNLTVQEGGKIIAEGTEDEPILFTSATGTSRQSWKNIYIYSSHNRFKWCTFEYGNWALKVEGYPDFATDNVIENCTFHDNDQALRIHKNTATVKNCNIYNNRHGLVCCNNTKVDFTGNHIYNNDRDGVYTWSGNHLNFLRNVIENNGLGHSSTCNGIYTRYSDVISLYPGSGKNTIRNNYNYEVYASYGSPTVEIGNPVLGGDNAIYDDTGYEIYNYSGNPKIWACYSWWGEYPPNSSRFYGSVNYSYPLSSEPSWVGSTTGGMGKAIAYGSDPSDLREKIKKLKEIIENSKSFSKEREEALFELYAIIRTDFVKDELGEKKNFYGYLEKIFNGHKAKRLGKIALEKMIIWKMLESDNNNAIKLSKGALKELEGEDRMSVLENLAMIYIDRGEIGKAKACLRESKEKYNFDQAGIEMIEEELADAESQIEEGILKPVISDEELAENSTSIPESFNLSQNYPNPGNPTTTIRFQLPQSSHVVLKIFNILGQEVKTLVDDYRKTGTYSVIWDGRDNQGIEMPSGVYLYILRAGDKVFTKKLTLLK